MDAAFCKNASKTRIFFKKYHNNLLFKDEIITLIIKNTHRFIIDQYGNYVLQFVVMMNVLKVNRLIAEQFLKMDFIFIAKQKFSSNVIEKV